MRTRERESLLLVTRRPAPHAYVPLAKRKNIKHCFDANLPTFANDCGLSESKALAQRSDRHRGRWVP
jgi:hypothetical protein